MSHERYNVYKDTQLCDVAVNSTFVDILDLKLSNVTLAEATDYIRAQHPDDTPPTATYYLTRYQGKS